MVPSGVLKADSTTTAPSLGNSQLRVIALGGVTAGVGLFCRTVVPARMLQIADRSMPTTKFVVSVLPVKLALKPSAHAGALSISLPLASANHNLPSGPATIPLALKSIELVVSVDTGNKVTRPAVVMRPSVLCAQSG